MKRERGQKSQPEPIGNAVADFLRQSGLADRVEAASVVEAWNGLVGKQIGGVTEALFVTPDGILFVAVKTHAWMTELSLLEPQLVASLNAGGSRPPVRKIRFRLTR